MIINIIIPVIAVSGGMRVIFRIAELLINKNNDVLLYTPLIPFNSYRTEFNYLHFKFRIRNSVKNVLKINKIPDKLKYSNIKIKSVPLISDVFIRDADAVIATSMPSAHPVHRLNNSKGVKFYFIQDHEIWKCSLRQAQDSYQLPFNRIVVSKYLKELLQTKYNSESVEIMPSVDYSIFKNENKVFNNPLKILFMDHELENKNAEVSIYTAVRIHKKYPDIEFRAFGTSKFREYPDFIQYYENIKDKEIVELYSTSDIFLFSSKYEGFGLTPAEAMACKCAVVGNAVAGFPEYAIENETAIFADPSDKDGLYKGVEKLIANPELLKKISINGFEYVRKKLNWEKSLDLFENFLLKRIKEK
ncbi:MAG: glycosyltransferase family 4 protein [Ignavibacteria bacterium]|nr:glycosyltransferase family 4 protein [Ignavibacteria bacterium]